MYRCLPSRTCSSVLSLCRSNIVLCAYIVSSSSCTQHAIVFYTRFYDSLLKLWYCTTYVPIIPTINIVHTCMLMSVCVCVCVVLVWRSWLHTRSTVWRDIIIIRGRAEWVCLCVETKAVCVGLCVNLRPCTATRSYVQYNYVNPITSILTCVVWPRLLHNPGGGLV